MALINTFESRGAFPGHIVTVMCPLYNTASGTDVTQVPNRPYKNPVTQSTIQWHGGCSMAAELSTTKNTGRERRAHPDVLPAFFVPAAVRGPAVRPEQKPRRTGLEEGR